jgi:hypothetical protein
MELDRTMIMNGGNIRIRNEADVASLVILSNILQNTDESRGNSQPR